MKGLCYTIARGERWYNIGQRRHTFSSECVLEQIILIRSLKRNQSIRISCPVDQLVVNAPSAAENLTKQRKNYTEASCFVDSRVKAPHAPNAKAFTTWSVSCSEKSTKIPPKKKPNCAAASLLPQQSSWETTVIKIAQTHRRRTKQSNK